MWFLTRLEVNGTIQASKTPAMPEAPPLNGRKLVQLREAARLTQRELAIRSGLTERTIGDLERGGQTNPKLETLEALAKALGVGVALLLDEPEPAGERAS